ncbi:hypothetical protein GPLA_2684 [Paraglaciecola polaris LMG 21857]|uniref:Uncharacterized protein n=1 Tax=Paraglaciecola polaris LMG 21857 TaxID=1129793 RepID=K6ZXV5_9ALTE|nr:hypothetical protein GPLA_2684 [Paraglaciecola polaris LMG 21857]
MFMNICCHLGTRVKSAMAIKKGWLITSPIVDMDNYPKR